MDECTNNTNAWSICLYVALHVWSLLGLHTRCTNHAHVCHTSTSNKIVLILSGQLILCDLYIQHVYAMHVPWTFRPATYFIHSSFIFLSCLYSHLDLDNNLPTSIFLQLFIRLNKKNSISYHIFYVICFSTKGNWKMSCIFICLCNFLLNKTNSKKL